MIVDEFGYVPFTKTGAELLFEFFAERYERGSVMITTNLPFEEWTHVLGCQRLSGALLDRLTHRVHILEMNGESYRFKESVKRLGKNLRGNQYTRFQAVIKLFSEIFCVIDSFKELCSAATKIEFDAERHFN